jgi:hypothetical protein
MKRSIRSTPTKGNKMNATLFVRLTGATGLAGALCLVLGDLLLTPGLPSPGLDVIAVRGEIEAKSLYISGLLGALGTLFYVFGAWHVYFPLRPAGDRLAAAALAAFAFMLVATGLYHAVFVAQNFGAKVALAATADPVAVLALALPEEYSNLILNLFVFPPAIVFSGLSAYLILSGSTHYPRWILTISPFLVAGAYALLTLVSGGAGPRLLSFTLIGNVYNLANLLFFAVSTVLLWNVDPDPPSMESAARQI